MRLRHDVFGPVVKSIMRLSVEYVNDAKGNVRAVQVPVEEWKRLVRSVEQLRQRSKIKSDLAAALKEVELKRRNNVKSKTLDEFLREL